MISKNNNIQHVYIAKLDTGEHVSVIGINVADVIDTIEIIHDGDYELQPKSYPILNYTLVILT